MIRTLASTKFITSSFWCCCKRIGILNNFLFNFLEFLNFIYIFIFIYIYFIYLFFILLYSKKILLNFQFHCWLDLCLLFICECRVGDHLTVNSFPLSTTFIRSNTDQENWIINFKRKKS
ncbi:MAG: hypothetical protein K6253_00740, partial [Candidatus Liberibacter asiaticus]|nr:hypothetical protein [Candidatus Liberibacter asiaticus]